MPQLRIKTREALNYFFGQMSDQWKELQTLKSLQSYCFTQGVAHLLSSQQNHVAEKLLFDFSYLMSRLKSENDSLSLLYDVIAVQYQGGLSNPAEFDILQKFLTSYQHKLARGNQDWSTDKILLQLAIEHADASPLTHIAERWLEEGNCDWIWLKRIRRNKEIFEEPCKRVYEGHTSVVEGVVVWNEHQFLSWSRDKSLILWNAKTGKRIYFRGHNSIVQGALILSDTQFVSWARDGQLCLWDIGENTAIQTIDGHQGQINGVHLFDEGSLFSWSDDGTIKIWDIQSGTLIKQFNQHLEAVNGVLFLTHKQFVSWSDDGTLIIWDIDNVQEVGVLRGHRNSIRGVIHVEQYLISWSRDKTVKVWNLEAQNLHCELCKHTGTILGVQQLTDSSFVSWDINGMLIQWNKYDCNPIQEFVGHKKLWIRGVLELCNGNILSWSDDRTIRIWDKNTASCFAVLRGHVHRVKGAIELCNGNILSWSDDRTIRIWDKNTASCLAVFEGHTSIIQGVLPLNKLFLSWSLDGQLRLWEISDNPIVYKRENHTRRIIGAKLLPNKNILSWSFDGTLRIWDLYTGQLLKVLQKHKQPVVGALLRQDTIVSWSRDNTLIIWDMYTGEYQTTLEGHTDDINGALLLPNGQIISWGDDKNIIIWDGQTAKRAIILEGHQEAITHVQIIFMNIIMSWSAGMFGKDHRLYLWNMQTWKCYTFSGHSQKILGGMELPNNQILTWSEDWILIVDVHTMTIVKSCSYQDFQKMNYVYEMWRTEYFSTMPTEKKSNGVEISFEDQILQWHGDGEWKIFECLSSGQFVVGQDKDLLLLHLQNSV